MDVKHIVSQMTLEEKCSLLSGGDFWNTRAVERLDIPSFMVSDGPHGLRKQRQDGDHLGINESIEAVCFPTACATAASFDRKVASQIGDGVGEASRFEKVAVALGPAVNIKRSPLCGRNFEYFSEDPYLTGELSVSFINALQRHGVGASVKHFAANSQEHRRMSSDSVVEERTLREIYFPAFEKSVKEAKTWTVMCSYNKLNGEYASRNHKLLTEILRDEWGFDGYVVSDWGATEERVACLEAGMDLEMPSSGGSNDSRVFNAVKEGRLEESVVDKAVERILTIHNRFLEGENENATWDMEAQHSLAGELASECMVLLKNEDALLPLQKTQKIAIIGKFAQTPRFQGGGSSHINSFKVTSLLQAMEGEDYSFAKGYDIVDETPDEALINEAVENAKQAEVAVIVAGLPDAFESEGYDRTHMRMPKCQVELIERVSAVNPNTVVVLYNGSPIEMPWADKVKAIIEGYLGGQNVGTATKNLLFGVVNPSGRLPESFPLLMEHNPSFLTYGGEGDRAVYTEGVFVGYRYYTKKNRQVRYPFGHGLSYTTFQYSNLTLDKEEMAQGDALTVSVDVTNTGKCFGKEVVMLYVENAPCDVFRPVRELRAFDKIGLEAGETKTVTFTLEERAFSYWNEGMHAFTVPKGTYGISMGKDCETMHLTKTVAHQGTPLQRGKYTVNSILMDIMQDPKAMAALAPLFGQMKSLVGGAGDSDSSSEAISPEMVQAMMGAMPLRSMVSFSGGKLSYETVEQMVALINQ